MTSDKTRSTSPVISIITVCFNDVSRVEQTVLSILNQTLTKREWIVIDGGSTDGTLDILSEYEESMTFFSSEPDKGIYDAMNKGIVRSAGEYLIFMNVGDTFYANDTLERFVDSKPKGDLIYGDIIVLHEEGEMVYKKMPPRLTHKRLMKYTLPHQATFTKRALYNRIGLFDLSFPIAADYKYSLAAIFDHQVHLEYVPLPVAVYSADGYSDSNPAQRETEKKAIQEELFGKSEWLESDHQSYHLNYVGDNVRKGNSTLRKMIRNIRKLMIR